MRELTAEFVQPLQPLGGRQRSIATRTGDTDGFGLAHRFFVRVGRIGHERFHVRKRLPDRGPTPSAVALGAAVTGGVRAVHRITLLGAVNAYLVREDDGFTLIDTLLTKSQGKILAAAQAAGAPIVRIVLTHCHDDHSGSLDALVDRLPDGVEVVFGEREAPLLAGDLSTRRGEPEIKGRHAAQVKTRPACTVSGGDRVGSLEVVEAFGHSPGQIALLDTRDRTLYCGDAYSTLGGVATTAKPYPRFPLPGLVTWDRGRAKAAAVALRALDPARLAPGHGKVVEAPGAAMDQAIACTSFARVLR